MTRKQAESFANALVAQARNAGISSIYSDKVVIPVADFAAAKSGMRPYDAWDLLTANQPMIVGCMPMGWSYSVTGDTPALAEIHVRSRRT